MIDADLDHFRAIVRTRTGLVLGADKRYLIESRLDAVARSQGLADCAAVLSAIRKGVNPRLLDAAIDAMNTHESLFFRDGLPFDQMAHCVVPQLVRRKPAGSPIRIWSAACSSGQEPYSLAMLLREHMIQLGGRSVEITATDISAAIIKKAEAGLYSEFEVNRGMDPHRRSRWMKPNGAQWEIAPEIKSMVRFRQHNLLDGPMIPAGFDIVFCRNVLIYFDVDGKRRALTNILHSMAPEAFLFLGAAETTNGLSDQFRIVTGQRGLLERVAPPSLFGARAAVG